VPAGILLESMAAFALTHMPFKWANRVFLFILIGLIVPIQMTLVPLTLLMNSLNLIDTLTGLILLYIGFGVPFGVLVMRGFFRTIPTAIIEAARIDGCSYFRIFFRIALPLAVPAVVSLCILDGVATWPFISKALCFHSPHQNEQRGPASSLIRTPKTRLMINTRLSTRS
jgi:raffinose/stachyose/melibiose transport system permease protein